MDAGDVQTCVPQFERHSIQYLLSKLVPSILMLSGVVFFVRVAGKAEYGRYSLYLSAVLFTLTFSSGWIGQSLLRFTSEYASDGRRPGLEKGVQQASIISLAAGTPLLFIAVRSMPTTPLATCFLCLAIYGLAFAYSLRNSSLQAGLSPGNVVKNEIVRAAVLVAAPLAIYLASGRLDSRILLVGSGLAYLAPLAASWRREGWVHPRRTPIEASDGASSSLPDFLRYGVPIGMWLAVAYLLNIADRYLIGSFLGYQEVGAYSAVYDLVFKATTMAFFPILAAAHPLIMNHWAADRRKSDSILRKALKYQVLVFPLALSALYFTAPLLSAALDVDRALFLVVGIPVALGAFFWQLSMLLQKPLECGGGCHLMLLFVTVALAVNVLGNIVLLPSYGIIAAAHMTLLSAFCYSVLVASQFRKFSRK